MIQAYRGLEGGQGADLSRLLIGLALRNFIRLLLPFRSDGQDQVSVGDVRVAKIRATFPPIELRQNLMRALGLGKFTAEKVALRARGVGSGFVEKLQRKAPPSGARLEVRP